MSKKKIELKYEDWLVCENLLGNETWLFHRGQPSFLGRVFDEEQAPVSGVTMSLNNGQTIANIIWYDDVHNLSTKKLVRLTEQAGKALDLYDGVLAVDRREGLRQEIEESGISIPAIARRAGVNQQTIYNYLKGRSDLTLDLYDRILDVL